MQVDLKGRVHKRSTKIQVNCAQSAISCLKCAHTYCHCIGDYCRFVGYFVYALWSYCSQNFKLFCFPIFRLWANLIKVITRNVSWALNVISLFLLQSQHDSVSTHLHDLSQNCFKKFKAFCIYNKTILSVICESIFHASIVNVYWKQKLIWTLLWCHYH